jgi:hypothetical protein
MSSGIWVLAGGGEATMKMISRQSRTSTIGVTLISHIESPFIAADADCHGGTKLPGAEAGVQGGCARRAVAQITLALKAPRVE